MDQGGPESPLDRLLPLEEGLLGAPDARLGALRDLEKWNDEDLMDQRLNLVQLLERVLVDHPFEYKARKQVLLLIPRLKHVLSDEALGTLKLDLKATVHDVPKRAIVCIAKMADLVIQEKGVVTSELLALLILGSQENGHRVRCYRRLVELASEEQNKSLMTAVSSEIPETVQRVLQERSPEFELVGYACDMICSLELPLPDASVHVKLREALLGSTDRDNSGILRVLAKLGYLRETLDCIVEKIKSPDQQSTNNIEDLLGFIEEIRRVDELLEYELGMCDPQLGLVSAVLATFDSSNGVDDDDDRVCQVWKLISRLMYSQSNVQGILASNVHELALSHLELADGDLSQIESDAFTYTVMTLVNLSRWPEARSHALFKRAGIDFAKKFYTEKSDGDGAMMSTILLANLVGDEESDEGRELLEGHPEVLLQIIECLVLTAKREDGPSYEYGVFSLSLITNAVKIICINDENKKHFADADVFGALLLVIEDFTSNKAPGKPRKGYGGGADTESVEASVDILSRFFYLADKNPDKLRTLVSVGVGVEAALNRLLPRLKEFKDGETKRSIERMLDLCGKLLRPSSTPAPAIPKLAEGKHIMVSYCWADKPRVVELCDELRSKGIDVWRDEVGSKVLGPMKGCIVDMMSRAVDCSSHVIICVSRKYKESENCRAEAIYARDRENQKRLKLHYVMMDETYHSGLTCAHPPDGWLGFMTAGKLWYPAWKDNQVASTAAALKDRVLEGLAIPSPASPLPSTSPSPSPSPASSQTSGWAELSSHHAWLKGVLKCEGGLYDKPVFQKTLNSLGISSPEDFDSGLLSSDILRRIADGFKPVKRKVFLALLCWHELVVDCRSSSSRRPVVSELSEMGISGPSDLLHIDTEDVELLEKRLSKSDKIAFHGYMGIIKSTPLRPPSQIRVSLDSPARHEKSPSQAVTTPSSRPPTARFSASSSLAATPVSKLFQSSPGGVLSGRKTPAGQRLISSVGGGQSRARPTSGGGSTRPSFLTPAPAPTPLERWIHRLLDDQEAFNDVAAFEATLKELGYTGPEDTCFLDARELVKFSVGLKLPRRKAFLYSHCWQILDDDTCSLAPAFMQDLLTELGVTKPSRLSLLDDDDIKRLLEQLKKVKRKRFLEIFNLARNL